MQQTRPRVEEAVRLRLGLQGESMSCEQRSRLDEQILEEGGQQFLDYLSRLRMPVLGSRLAAAVAESAQQSNESSQGAGPTASSTPPDQTTSTEGAALAVPTTLSSSINDPQLAVQAALPPPIFANVNAVQGSSGDAHEPAQTNRPHLASDTVTTMASGQRAATPLASSSRHPHGLEPGSIQNQERPSSKGKLSASRDYVSQSAPHTARGQDLVPLSGNGGLDETRHDAGHDGLMSTGLPDLPSSDADWEAMMQQPIIEWDKLVNIPSPVCEFLN
jgi:hypothetical protein